MRTRQRLGQKGTEEMVQQRSKAKPTPLEPVRRPDLTAPGLSRRAVTRPGRMTPGGMQVLQRAYGNRAVTRLLPGQEQAEITPRAKVSTPVIQRTFYHKSIKYVYGYEFRGKHLSNETGDALKKEAKRRAKRYNSDDTTVVNTHSLDNASSKLSHSKPPEGYDFGLDATPVEAYTGYKSGKDPIKRTWLEVSGYKTTWGGRKITHLETD
jgi:hypothetical protein